MDTKDTSIFHYSVKASKGDNLLINLRTSYNLQFTYAIVSK